MFFQIFFFTILLLKIYTNVHIYFCVTSIYHFFYQIFYCISFSLNIFTVSKSYTDELIYYVGNEFSWISCLDGKFPKGFHGKSFWVYIYINKTAIS